MLGLDLGVAVKECGDITEVARHHFTVISADGKIKMPQSERSKIIKEMLEFLMEHPRGVSVATLIRHVELEITDMGASTRTIRGYVDRCRRQGLIIAKGTRLVYTDKCKNWLQKKVS